MTPMNNSAGPDLDSPDAAHRPEQWPAVSVVMPVLNEEKYLAEAVAKVLAQNYPGDMELVCAIGPSRDRTKEVADRLAATDPRVRVVDNPSGRTPDALNAAIAATSHPIVVRVDGHAELSEGYIRTAVRELLRVGADNVGGIMNAHGRTTMEKAVAAAMRSPIGVGNARFHVGGDAGPADTVYLGVFRREALESAGGYDPHFTRAQDWELNHRIREAGGLVWFTPELSVTYRPRGSFRGLAQQYFNYGRWRRVVAARHEGTINLRYLAPPTMVLGTTAATLLGAVWRPAWIVPAGYVVGIVVGSAFAGSEESPRVRALLPAVLATMHWAWGIGFITSPQSLREQHAESVEIGRSDSGTAATNTPAAVRSEARS